MAVPKRKKSRSRTAMKRANWKAQEPSKAYCSQCHSPKLPHRACPTCGTYNGREVIETE